MKTIIVKDGVNWFVCVVEDRQDPKTLGRVRVRCLGYHTEDLDRIPTADLPWAHVMNPITSATVSGVGQTPLGMVEGTWVVGFFTDGEEAQLPMIMGTLPGVPAFLPGETTDEYGRSRNASGQAGFEDPLGNFPKYTETDVNRLAVNEKTDGAESNPHSSLTLRRADVDTGVSVADIDEVLNIAGADNGEVAADLGGTWDEPETTYNTTYPKNHVYESEGGHIREYDDTEGAKRIHERHAAGTGYEIDNDGTKITRVKKDNYTIITADDYVHIQGDARQTIDKGLRVFMNTKQEAGNNYNIEVGANANVTVQVNKGNINLLALGDSDINLKATADLNVEVGKNFNVTVGGNASETVNGKKDELVTGNNTKTGARIDLN